MKAKPLSPAESAVQSYIDSYTEINIQEKDAVFENDSKEKDKTLIKKEKKQ